MMQSIDDSIIVPNDLTPRDFTTVFDAGKLGSTTWWVATYGLIVLIVGALLLFRPALMQRVMPNGLESKARAVFSLVLFHFALTGMSFMSMYRGSQSTSEALNARRYSVVSGPVENFVPMPYGRHARESFTVQGKHFSYSDYILTAGFHHTASHGGPIREGLYVRVSYSGDLILRLEIARP